MATFTEVDVFSENLAKGVHNLDTNAFKWLLSATLPVITTAPFPATSIAQIATGGGYTAWVDGGATGFTPALDVAAVRAGQVTTVSAVANSVLTATGAVASFRYIVLIDDTPTSPANPVVGFLDHTSNIVMATTDTYTIPSGPLFTVNS